MKRTPITKRTAKYRIVVAPYVGSTFPRAAPHATPDEGTLDPFGGSNNLLYRRGRDVAVMIVPM
jgi:hypothetical protein